MPGATLSTMPLPRRTALPALGRHMIIDNPPGVGGWLGVAGIPRWRELVRAGQVRAG